jgi:hypothetical protein
MCFFMKSAIRRATLARLTVAVLGAVVLPALAAADIVGGGGSKKYDCIAVFDAPGANHPPPPKVARSIDCFDGDPTCDADADRNGRCVFDLQVCVNSTQLADCTPLSANGVTVAHSDDNGDPKFDPDFQAIQQRVDQLGFPGNESLDDCTTVSSVTVPLRVPNSGSKLKIARKIVRLDSSGVATGKSANDRDKMKLTCRPEGDGVYTPGDLYEGTFDRIRHQIFAQSCALSACHDSESFAGNMILLPNAAYSQIVGVTPDNAAAANDGLLRITPGDPEMSFLYRKIDHDLEAGYGSEMPLDEPQLSADLIELVRLWILGDMTLGPAPELGWVEGTDQ